MMTMWREDLPRGITPLRFFLFCSRPYLLLAFGSLLAAIAGSIMTSSSAYFFKLIVDAATSFNLGDSGANLWYAIGLYIAASAGMQALWRVSGYLGMRWATGVRATGRYALSSYVTLHSQDYFSNRFAGSLLSKIANAGNSLKSAVSDLLWTYTYNLVSVIASIAFMFMASNELGLIFIVWVSVVVPINIFFARRKTALSSAAQRAETRLGGATVDMLANMSAVEEYASRPFELAQLKSLILSRRTIGLRNWIYGENILVLNGVLQVIFISGLLVVSTQQLIAGSITPGDIALVLTVVIFAEEVLRNIGQQINNFSENWGQIVESLEEIMAPHEVTDIANPLPLVPHQGSVHFDNVTFTYGNVTVFDRFLLDIPQGQRVGLVGRSGAGKSTLFKLLLRHYDIQSGAIRIAEVPIAQVAKETLRQQIAVVPQEPLLFHRTIRENIAYGNHGATEEEIINAAKLAEAHEFIVLLPEGYDSLVGERGIKLSGGQRQRIAIARAMLKNAPILLLDEATSALDSESETAVQKALLNLMQNRTVIAIAHRLSTLRAMDRIIVMDKGKITEDGTHEELLEKKGLYASLWSHQASGFLEE
jgi:ATP-binding cassette, subfamily B, bacterial